MSRYTGSTWKISRRLNKSILENNKELKKRKYSPGQHGPTKRNKITEYGTQLQMKQFVRFMYGINERQFRTIFKKSGKLSGNQGHNFLFMLESRLDNLVYRMGIAPTRKSARQLVNHGHILVDGKKLDIPSAIIKPGQEISLKDKIKKSNIVLESIKNINHLCKFVEFDTKTMIGKYIRYPERSELNDKINEKLIIEWYNR